MTLTPENKIANPKRVGRLAFRVEGSIWTAYYAKPDTMEGALWLGAIKLSIVRNPERKEAFMNIMRSVVEDILGKVESWLTEPAPEHEKSGTG